MAANQSPPTVDGSGDLNEIEAADVGIWSGLPSAYTYQWELCDNAGANCADIPGATSHSYVPGVVDYGQTLRVRVVATNGVGSSAPVESAPSGVIGLATAPPELASPPVVSASPLVGQPLSTTNGTWTNSAISYAYQWQRCDDTGSNCADIPGATSSQYTPVEDDIASTLRSGVLASNSVGPASSGYALSVPTGVVTVVGAPALLGSANDEATAEEMDVNHDGYMADAGLSGQLTQAWSINLGADVSYPLIAQGMVFATGLNGLTGSTADTLTAINQATGNIVWSAQVGNEAQPTAIGLAYDRGRVFVTDETTGLSVFDAATGREDWNLRLPYEGFQSPPTAANGIVYINTGDDLIAAREDGHGHGVGTAGSIPADTTITSVPVPDGTTAPVANGASITVTAPGSIPYYATLRVTANVVAGATSIPVSVVLPDPLTHGWKHFRSQQHALGGARLGRRLYPARRHRPRGLRLDRVSGRLRLRSARGHAALALRSRLHWRQWPYPSCCGWARLRERWNRQSHPLRVDRKPAGIPQRGYQPRSRKRRPLRVRQFHAQCDRRGRVRGPRLVRPGRQQQLLYVPARGRG